MDLRHGWLSPELALVKVLTLVSCWPVLATDFGGKKSKGLRFCLPSSDRLVHDLHSCRCNRYGGGENMHKLRSPLFWRSRLNRKAPGLSELPRSCDLPGPRRRGRLGAVRWRIARPLPGYSALPIPPDDVNHDVY
jgi:hypothetical protein